MYLVLKSKNGTELERFKKEKIANEVAEHYRKYGFPNCCVEEYVSE
jgi:hypothetical protein